MNEVLQFSFLFDIEEKPRSIPIVHVHIDRRLFVQSGCKSRLSLQNHPTPRLISTAQAASSLPLAVSDHGRVTTVGVRAIQNAQQLRIRHSDAL